MNNLSFRAGSKAQAIIRDGGLKPEMVKVIDGAAGGPKWLVLHALDQCIFSAWLKDRKEPLFLIGASSGAWRFAAVTQRDPVSAIQDFRHAYIHQVYHKKPTKEEVSREGLRILDDYLDKDRVSQVLSHPCLRLNIMAVRSKGLAASDQHPWLGMGMAGAAICNAISRKWLRLFFERVLFYDPRDIPPYYHMNGLPLQQVPLNEKGLKTALLASGSIPLVMSGISEIPEAEKGVYRDGGIIDYHMDLPYQVPDQKVVLMPHFYEYIIPGWFDKPLPWRKASGSNLANLVLVSPSQSFIESLPFKKIPDRDDFFRFRRRDQERIDYWNVVVSKSKVLGDEFLEAVTSGKIRHHIQAL